MATLRWLSRNLRRFASDYRKLRSDRQGRELEDGLAEQSPAYPPNALAANAPPTTPRVDLPRGPEAN